jgi:hypothetical protein
MRSTLSTRSSTWRLKIPSSILPTPSTGSLTWRSTTYSPRLSLLARPYKF